MSRKQIDDCLDRYYQLKGVAYYNRYKGCRSHPPIGMFSEWCQHNGYDSDSIYIELQKQPEQCRLIQFDPFFPAMKHIGYQIETDKKNIFQVIKKCWDDSNAFILDLIFHDDQKKDPNPYIFDDIQRKQRLWFDGYFQQNHNVYIPLEIINIIRFYFKIDMKSLYILYIDNKTYIQRLCDLANNLEKGEYFIAYNILSSLISANIHNDDATNAALYFDRALILRRWKVLNKAEEDIKLSIQYQSKGIAMYEYGKMLFVQRKYPQALEIFIDAIALNEKENNIKAHIKCHSACCKVYAAMKHFHNARMHYLRIISLEPSEACHLYNYAKYLEKKIKDYDKAGRYYKKAIALNCGEYKYRYYYGRMLTNHTKQYMTALEQLFIASKIKPDESKCAHLIGQCYDGYLHEGMYNIQNIKGIEICS